MPSQDTTTTRGWRAWQVPSGASWVFIYMQGAGGGGGNGFSAAAGSARGGGGGGASGGLTKLFLPAVMLPNMLYFRPGSGGAPVTAGTTSYVSVAANTTVQNLVASIVGGGAGGTGTGAAAGAAGTAGAATAVNLFAVHGLYFVQAGNAGFAGGAQTGAAGVSITQPTGVTSPTTGGAGGGGTPTANTNFAGGALSAAGPWPAIAGGLAGGGAGNPGCYDNIPLEKFAGRLAPFLTSGGTGGGTNGAAGTGGAGGQGGWGSGGGGGGGAVTGGAGGVGGDGFILVGAF